METYKLALFAFFLLSSCYKIETEKQSHVKPLNYGRLCTVTQKKLQAKYLSKRLSFIISPNCPPPCQNNSSVSGSCLYYCKVYGDRVFHRVATNHWCKPKKLKY